MKRIATLIAIVLGFALLATLIYFSWDFIRPGPLFFSGQKTPPPTKEEPQILSEISSGPVFDYFFTQKGILLIKENGEISIKNEKGESILSPATSEVPWRASISFDKQYLLVGFGERDFPRFSIFDLTRKVWIPLRLNNGSTPIIDAVWAPVGLRIAFLEKTTNASSLGLIEFGASDKNKTSTTTPAANEVLSSPSIRRLAALSVLDMRLSWLLPERIYLESIPSALSPGFVLWYDLKNNTINPLFSDELGLSVKWREDGELGIKFSLRGQNILLALVDSAGKILDELLFTAIPEKCTLYEKMIYCALPTNLPPRVQLPDDYYQKSFPMRERILRGLPEERKFETLISEDLVSLDASKLKADSNNLFFINDYNKKLYRVTR